VALSSGTTANAIKSTNSNQVRCVRLWGWFAHFVIFGDSSGSEKSA
jgi:hypothetical protein